MRKKNLVDKFVELNHTLKILIKEFLISLSGKANFIQLICVKNYWLEFLEILYIEF